MKHPKKFSPKNFSLGNLSAQHRPAVYVQDLARDMSRPVAAKKQYWPCNILSRSHTPERYFPQNLFPGLFAFKRSRSHLRINPAGSHSVYVNSVSAQLRCKRFGESYLAAFRRSVI